MTRESVDEHLRQILQVTSEEAVQRHALAALHELRQGRLFPVDVPLATDLRRHRPLTPAERNQLRRYVYSMKEDLRQPWRAVWTVRRLRRVERTAKAVQQFAARLLFVMGAAD